jgi:hypothetical protein
MVQAWRVGEERAETYLRLLAEAELRRAGDQLRCLDAAAGTDGASGPGSERATADRALWKVIRAGRILVAVGALDHDDLARFENDLHAAITVRSRLLLKHDQRRVTLHGAMFAPRGRPALPSGPVGRAMRVTPIGRALRVATGRAPSMLHLISLVRTDTPLAVITVAMRMHWLSEGPDTELEIAEAGLQHLLSDQLWAVDDQGTRYTVHFEGYREGTATWLGIARLQPAPPRGARRLDLVSDGTRLIRLPLDPSAARSHPAVPSAAEPVAVAPGERLLVLEAERILASGDARGPAQGPIPGETITVLTEAGAIAADSPVPGQLAALCHRLSVSGHGITGPPAAQIPAPWASVLAHRDAPTPIDGPDACAPLACVLPDVDGARFALAGLSTAAGESHLHVISNGMPQLMDRFDRNWTPGFSWWLRDGARNWHVATAGEPRWFLDGTQAFRLRLTPSLAAVPDAAEVVVTGPATRVRATIPIRPAPGTSED